MDGEKHFYAARCSGCRRVVKVQDAEKFDFSFETYQYDCPNCGKTRVTDGKRVHRYWLDPEGKLVRIAKPTEKPRVSDHAYTAELSRVRTLYKYVTPERVDAFRDGFLRFTPPAECNDLTEFSPTLKDDFEEIGERLAIGISEIWFNNFHFVVGGKPDAAFREAFIRRSADTFRAQYGSMHTFFLEWVQSLRSKKGVLSLTEDPFHPVMWAHYAANHMGFVLEFDLINDFFFSRFGSTRYNDCVSPVIYSRTRRYTAKTLDMAALMFEKDSQWSYEKEWRLVRSLEDADVVKDGKIHLFRFPPDIVKSVILGIKTPPAVREELLSLAANDPRYKRVTVSEIVQRRGKLRKRVIQKANEEVLSFGALFFAEPTPEFWEKRRLDRLQASGKLKPFQSNEYVTLIRTPEEWEEYLKRQTP